MDGYHNLPDKTAEAFTDDGWLRTGDVGNIDADGFLTVTGRIKEIFKTSGGKYIAPPAIEAKFMAICPYASQFMVFGEARNYCVALISLDADLMSGWARRERIRRRDLPGAGQRAAVREMIGGYVAHSERRTQPMGNRQEVGAAGPRSVHRGRRADTVIEGEARRGGRAEQAHPRLPSTPDQRSTAECSHAPTRDRPSRHPGSAAPPASTPFRVRIRIL